jgi:hypothetical protein
MKLSGAVPGRDRDHRSLFAGRDAIRRRGPQSRRRVSGGMGGLLALAGVMMLTALLPLAAQAGAGPVGSVFHGYLSLNGKQVPLPAGEWVLVGDSYEVLPSVAGGAGDAVESVVLFQLSGSSVPAFVAIHRNAIGVDKGWGVAAECSRTDLYAAIAYENSDTHGFCGFATYVLTATPSDGAALSWKQALDYARLHGLTLPDTWLMGGFRLSDARDLVDVRYHFDPALAGLPTRSAASWQDSDWAVARLDAAAAAPAVSWSDTARRWASYAYSLGGSEPEKLSQRRAAVDGLVAWLDSMRYPVELGFKNRLSGVAAVVAPWAGGEAAPSPAFATRIERLDELRAMKALSEAQYDVQLAIIQSEQASVAGERWTAEGLTTAKAATNQVSTNIAAFAADYVMTGSIATSLSLIGVHTVVDVGQYWSTEWAWNTFGPRKIEALQTVDLPAAGFDGSPLPAVAPFQSPVLQQQTDNVAPGGSAGELAASRLLGTLQ